MDISSGSAIVTGGAGGFGAATVRRLAERGAKVIIADVADERGEALAKEIGPNALYVRTDCMDEDAIARAVETAVGLAPLRAAVITHRGPPFPGSRGPSRILDREGKRLPLANFAHNINVFLNSAYAVTSQAAEAMARNEPLASNQRGVVINTASIAGFEGQPGQAAYSAAKGGIIGMTLPAARDLAAIGVRVNTIAPGVIDTPIYGGGPGTEDFKARLTAPVVFPKRMGTAAEFAHLVRALIENDYMNAEVIRFDGGIRFQPK